jgi:hypothetical protein
MADPSDFPVSTPAALTLSGHRMPLPLILAMTASTLCYVIFSMHLAIAIFADAGFDDVLFLKHAESLVAGHWLGAYSQTTLMKGPGFPFFLAANALLGFPVTLSLALLYSAVCLLLVTSLFRISGGPWVCLLSFLFMQWHPCMVPIHIIRDDVSASQVLLVLGCLCHFVFLPTRLRNRLGWAAAGGFALAWFWMTREDAVWIVPGLAVICLLQAWRLLPAWPQIKRLAAAVTVFGIAAFGMLGVIATINLMVYGTFEIVDFKNPQFARALDVLQSVQVGAPVPYVPVPEKVRKKLDTVSPAFASLEPYFNGAGQTWTQPGCAVAPVTCGDIAGGWFMWALRDAVGSQGYYASPERAAAFYHRLWTEVNNACKARQLECRRNFLPFMPAMRPDQWDHLPAELQRIYGLASFQIGQPDWLTYERALLRSTGDATKVEAMRGFLGHPLSAPTVNEDMSSRVGLQTAAIGIYPFAGGSLSIDRLRPGAGAPGEKAAGMLQWLGDLYGWVTPAGTALALLAYALSAAWALARDRRRRFDAQLVILTGIGTLLLVRAAILVLVDISSFPAITQAYWGAGYPLLSLAIVLSLSRLAFRGKA